MIIYNKNWLNNLRLHQQIDADQAADILTSDEVTAIKSKYPVGFYSHGIILRIGFFILTIVLLIFACGLLSLMASEVRIVESFGWLLFLGIGTYVVLEYIVRENNHYRSGVDDALMWVAGGLFTGSFIWLIETIDTAGYENSHAIGISVFVLLLAGYFTLRFADILMSVVTSVAFLSAVFFIWNKLGALGIATIPFIMMLASVSIYLIGKRFNRHPKALYYANCLIAVQLIGLVTLYLSGNYFIIDQLGSQLTPNTSFEHAPVRLGWLFWLWTILVPFFYIAIGLRKKNVLFLRLGLLLVAATVFTVRYYYHILPTEMALILGGGILLALVYAVVRYLKTPKQGFTYAETATRNKMDQLKVESLLVAQTTPHTPHIPIEHPDRFGGGSFGGGGSSSSF
ncbi:sugar porter family MFS transporter [Mucilaginibacter robiniae]|uniref:Sugar porter family MFS transporter n=1 Tax=Mucilaginibacter robiniae TaxID=2728022 RepID=A0A7L5DTQ7_9SPHI|nr:hypothetical protein [Mucilaginibacter robiniae]QJD94495.1 sugar porter family MFS transporter [Mucilaginibacter robiniae]